MAEIVEFFRTQHRMGRLKMEGLDGKTEVGGDWFRAEPPADGAEVTYVDYGSVKNLAIVHWRRVVQV